MAGVLSALPIIKLATKRELQLMKFMLYPRVLNCIYNELIDRNLINDYGKVGQHVFFVLTEIVAIYGWIYEPEIFDPSFIRSIDKWANLAPGDIMAVRGTRGRVAKLLSMS